MKRERIPLSTMETVLVRSRRRCALCFLEGDDDPKEGNIAHIIPVRAGGASSSDNLVFLCQNHHSEYDGVRGNGSISPELIASARERLYSAIAQSPASGTSTRPQIFIAHGRNEAAKSDLALFLRNNGIEPIVLTEELGLGRTALEKLQDSHNVQYAIALLTPDERVYSTNHANAPATRPQQNVVFELGYFVGRLGANRVCALHHPAIELPSDLHGTLYIPLDQDGRWQTSLTRQLRMAGLPMVSE